MDTSKKKPSSLVLERFHPLDLTHPLDEQNPTWTGRCGFRLEIKIDYPAGLRAQTLKSHAGVGTHMDAPSHFIDGGANVGDIPLERLIVPLIVMDIRSKSCPGFFIQRGDIETFEKQNGIVPSGSLFAAWTGWDAYWHSPQDYRSVDSEGKMHFPGFSSEAADLLVERRVAGVAIDTLSPDGANDTDFPVHKKLLGANIYILENLCSLGQMPAQGGYALVMPPRVRQGAESVCRVVGLISAQIPTASGFRTAS